MSKIEPVDLSRRIQELRKQKKLSLFQLAIKSDVDRAVISKFESQSRDIRISSFLKILDGLDVSLEKFSENL